MNLSSRINLNRVFPFLILIAFFIYYSYQNLIFSSSMESIILREIDELAFQIIISNFHNQFFNNEYAELMRTNDYGYGFIFWLLYGILTLPIVFLQNYFPNLPGYQLLDNLMILIPRQLSLVFTFLGILIWFKILHTILDNWRIFICSLFTLLILITPTLAYSATKFHPTGLLFFTSSVFFYYFFKIMYSKSINYNDTFLLTIFLAISIAVKLNGIILLPFFMSILLIKFIQQQLDLRKLVSLKFLSIIFIFILCLSPLLPFDLILTGRADLISIVRDQISMKGISENSLSFTQRLLGGLKGFYLSEVALGFLLIILFFSFIFLISKFRLNKFHLFNLLAVALNLFVSISYLVLVVHDSSAYLNNYASPILPLIFLLFFKALDLMPNQILSMLTSLVFSVVTIISNLTYIYFPPGTDFEPRNLGIRPINYFQSLTINEKSLHESSSFSKIRSRDLFKSSNIGDVLVDFRSMVPINPLTSEFNFTYSFDNENIYIPKILDFQYVYLITSNESKASSLLQESPECDLFLNDDQFNLCNLQRILTSNNLCNDMFCYRRIYSDDFVYIYRKENIFD